MDEVTMLLSTATGHTPISGLDCTENIFSAALIKPNRYKYQCASLYVVMSADEQM